LYDYSCTLCGHAFEAFQKMKDQSLHTCPECGHRALDRIIGAPAIRTDATFVRGKGTLLDQFQGDEAEVKRVTDAAKSQGYTPSASDIYEPCIAKCKGDPEAFLPASDPVGSLRRVCKKRGIGCEGRGVTIKAPPSESPPKRRAVGAT
jgi:putative FmdB family regulatory protein